MRLFRAFRDDDVILLRTSTKVAFAEAMTVIKILLVEDDPDALDLAAYVLRRERFVVLEASDGAQALRRWKADRPDLVILDLGVPSLDGFEVLRRIRDEDQTPVLVLTGR